MAALVVISGVAGWVISGGRGYSLGISAGDAAGWQRGYDQGRQDGYSQGYSAGYDAAYDDGWQQGYLDGLIARYSQPQIDWAEVEWYQGFWDCDIYFSFKLVNTGTAGWAEVRFIVDGQTRSVQQYFVPNLYNTPEDGGLVITSEKGAEWTCNSAESASIQISRTWAA